MWLKPNTVAVLENITERSVRRNAKNGKYGEETEGFRYLDGKGRGGKILEIALESLPQAAQDRYNNIDTPRTSHDEMMSKYTGKQRETANYHAQIVKEYQQSGLSPDKFVSKHNSENPDDTITKSQLFRWQNKLKQNSDVADLIDRRGGHNRGKTSISSEVWEYFCGLYLTQQKRSISLCRDLTQAKLPDIKIPHVSSFERKVALDFSEYDILYYREGKKSFKDKLPSMIRDKTSINSNDIWFSDHHESDVFVVNHSGKVVRLWITVFFDARSNFVLGCLARNANPNATAIKECFRKSAEKYGIPKEFYFDNGKDYTSKAFSVDFPQSITNQLGINTIYATPYHGQAKTVERFFGTLEGRFGKRFETYAGRDAKNRPECMRISKVEIAKIAPSMDEFINALDNYIIEYNRTPSRAKGLDGKCPEQTYYENLKDLVTVKDPAILRTLCGTFAERTIQTNGIQILDNFYRSDFLTPYLGKKVIVSYYPDNINEINVFDTDRKAICIAYAMQTTPFRNTTEEDYKKAKKEQKVVKDFVRTHQPSRVRNVHNIIAENQLEEKNYSDGVSVATNNKITRINPQISKNQETFKSTEKGKVRRIREEDNIARQLLNDYKKQQGG